jgi:hypothetical protein
VQDPRYETRSPRILRSSLQVWEAERGIIEGKEVRLQGVALKRSGTSAVGSGVLAPPKLYRDLQSFNVGEK